MAHILLGSQYPENYRMLRILVAAAHCGVQVDVSQEFRFSKTDSTPEWIRNCHPLGKSPVLQTPEGYLFDSYAIIRYVARAATNGATLYGVNAFEASQIDMWIEFAMNEVELWVIDWFKEFRVGAKVSEARAKELSVGVHQLFDGLELWLSTRTFLVGERLSIADISVACTLNQLFRFNPDAVALSKKYPGVWRLYNTTLQHPKSVEALKKFGATFGFRTVKPAATKPEEKEKKEEAPQKEAQKKKDVEDDDDGEDHSHQEKKKANPLDSLPPSPFILDAFKREYSNNDKRTIGSPYFLKNFDAAGFTTYWCRYKYNEDNKMSFMTGNLVRGWFQRMEAVRKYAFGIVLIIGEEKKHEIVGLWVFRGKGIPECVKEVEDTELFEWKEITDIHAEAGAITDYLSTEGTTITLPVMDARCFK